MTYRLLLIILVSLRLSSSFCTTKINRYEISSFTGNQDIRFNSLGNPQGLSLGTYSSSGSDFAQITAESSSSSWYSNLLDSRANVYVNQSYKCMFDISKYHFMEIEVQDISFNSISAFVSFALEDPVFANGDSCSLTNNISLPLSTVYFNIPKEFFIQDEDTGLWVVAVPLSSFSSSISSPSLVHSIGISKFSPIPTTLLLHGVNLISISSSCTYPANISNKGFIWKRNATLMYRDRPFYFYSFICPVDVQSYTFLDLQDIVQTISIFGGGTSAIFRFGDLMRLGVNGPILTSTLNLNEEYFQRFDYLLELCNKFNVKILISLIGDWGDGSVETYVTRFSLSSKLDFYKNRSMIKTFKSLISKIIYRNNSITGIPYTDNPVIMAWQLGGNLKSISDGTLVPDSWVMEISDYIRSIDPNHLIFDSSTHNTGRYWSLKRWTMPNIDGLSQNLWFSYEYNWWFDLINNNGQLFMKNYLVAELPNWADQNEWLGYFSKYFESSYQRSPFSGIFIWSMSGRKQGGGWTDTSDWAVHFPGLDTFEKNLLKKISGISRAIKVMGETNGDLSKISYSPIEEFNISSPIIVSTKVLSTSVSIEWYGAAGASSHKLFRSTNNMTFSVSFNLDDNSNRIVVDSIPTKRPCPIIYYYRLEAYGGWTNNIKSNPVFFSVIINATTTSTSSCFPSSSTVIHVTSKSDYTSEYSMGYPDNYISLILITSIIGGTLILLGTAIILMRFKNRPQQKRLEFQSYIKTNHASKLSSHSHFDNNSLTITNTLSNSDTLNGAIFVPGYMSIDVNTDIHIDATQGTIGEGGTGFICKGSLKSMSLISKHGLIPLAIKCIKNPEPSSSVIDKNPSNSGFLESKSSFMYEVAIMASLPKSENLILFVGYSEDPMIIVMKYYPISLKQLITNYELDFTNIVNARIALDIASGLKHLHNSGIIHLDMKPHNVLIDVKNDATFSCVICDFGFANFIGDNSSQRTIASGLKVPQTNGLTVRYASPELIDKVSNTTARLNSENDKKIDIYAFAIIMYEVITRSTAWYNMSPPVVIYNVKKGNRPTLSSSDESYDELSDDMKQKLDKICSDNTELVKIIKSSWDIDPEKRPTATAIHKLIEGYFSQQITDNFIMDFTQSISIKMSK